MLTNEELLGLFEESLSSDFERLSESTVAQNIYCTKRILDTLDKPAIDVSQSDIKSYMVNLRCLDGSPMNIDSKDVHLSKIKNFFNFLYTTDNVDIVKDRYYTIDGKLTNIPKQNPTSGIKRMASSKAAKLERNAPKVGLKKEQYEKLLEVISEQKEKAETDFQREIITRDYAMIRLMIELGQRVSDIINLNVSNFEVNEDNVCIMNFIITKTKEKSSLAVSQEVFDALNEYWNIRECKTDIAFTSKFGGRISANKINVRLKKYGKLAGIDEDKISNHILRHTCGSKLANELKDESEIQVALVIKKVLGHKSIISTYRYIENNDKDKINNILVENHLANVI